MTGVFKSGASVVPHEVLFAVRIDVPARDQGVRRSAPIGPITGLAATDRPGPAPAWPPGLGEVRELSGVDGFMPFAIARG